MWWILLNKISALCGGPYWHVDSTSTLKGWTIIWIHYIKYDWMAMLEVMTKYMFVMFSFVYSTFTSLCRLYRMVWFLIVSPTQVCLSGHEPGLTHGQSVDPRDGCRPGPSHQLLVPQTGHRHSTATPPRNSNLRGSPLQWKAQLFTRWVKGNLKCLQGWWKKSLTVFRWLNKKSSICILKYRNRWMNLCL